jgi:hypothetical protein
MLKILTWNQSVPDSQVDTELGVSYSRNLTQPCGTVQKSEPCFNVHDEDDGTSRIMALELYT